jgi:phytoene desaturase
LRQIGPMRPAARSRAVRGLYLAGASTNPGGGIPLVLASGRQSADALLGDLGRAAARRRPRLRREPLPAAVAREPEAVG